MNKILVVAAHSDDEALGCGGTIARHAAEGDKVHVIYMTDGVSARPEQKGHIEQQVRNDAALKACQILGVEKSYQFNFPDNQMDSVPLLSLTQAIESIVSTYKPNIIYTHHHGDLNIDHQLTLQATLTACRPQPESSVEKILSFEVPSSTEWNSPYSKNTFSPNCFIDVSKYMDTKLAALLAYEEEMRSPPHSRSLANISNTAKVRGHSIGVNSAEAFMIQRLIQR